MEEGGVPSSQPLTPLCPADHREAPPRPHQQQPVGAEEAGAQRLREAGRWFPAPHRVCPPRAAPGRARASPALPGKFPAPPSLLGVGQAGEGRDPADDRRPPENAAHGGRERYGAAL